MLTYTLNAFTTVNGLAFTQMGSGYADGRYLQLNPPDECDTVGMELLDFGTLPAPVNALFYAVESGLPSTFPNPIWQAVDSASSTSSFYAVGPNSDRLLLPEPSAHPSSASSRLVFRRTTKNPLTIFCYSDDGSWVGGASVLYMSSQNVPSQTEIWSPPFMSTKSVQIGFGYVDIRGGTDITHTVNGGTEEFSTSGPFDTEQSRSSGIFCRIGASLSYDVSAAPTFTPVAVYDPQAVNGVFCTQQSLTNALTYFSLGNSLRFITRQTNNDLRYFCPIAFYINGL